jgi:hypothetical protein
MPEKRITITINAAQLDLIIHSVDSTNQFYGSSEEDRVKHYGKKYTLWHETMDMLCTLRAANQAKDHKEAKRTSNNHQQATLPCPNTT